MSSASGAKRVAWNRFEKDLPNLSQHGLHDTLSSRAVDIVQSFVKALARHGPIQYLPTDFVRQADDVPLCPDVLSSEPEGLWRCCMGCTAGAGAFADAVRNNLGHAAVLDEAVECAGGWPRKMWKMVKAEYKCRRLTVNGAKAQQYVHEATGLFVLAVATQSKKRARTETAPTVLKRAELAFELPKHAEHVQNEPAVDEEGNQLGLERDLFNAAFFDTLDSVLNSEFGSVGKVP